MPAVTQYLAPQSLEEATRALADGGVSMFAGGTDLMVQTRTGARELQPVLMSLSRIRGLRGVSESDGLVRIGALTTITDILRSDLLRDIAGVLVDTADCFASVQLRNIATIGGNICNASPAGDMIIPLLLLDAEVELASWKRGEVTRRTMPLCEFFVEPGVTAKRPDELLAFVRFPVPDARTVERLRQMRHPARHGHRRGFGRHRRNQGQRLPATGQGRVRRGGAHAHPRAHDRSGPGRRAAGRRAHLPRCGHRGEGDRSDLRRARIGLVSDTDDPSPHARAIARCQSKRRLASRSTAAP